MVQVGYLTFMLYRCTGCRAGSTVDEYESCDGPAVKAQLSMKNYRDCCGIEGNEGKLREEFGLRTRLNNI